MKKKLYNKIINELDALPLTFVEPNLPIDKREAARLEYCAATDKILAKYGITTEEMEKEMERRLDAKYGRGY